MVRFLSGDPQYMQVVNPSSNRLGLTSSSHSVFEQMMIPFSLMSRYTDLSCVIRGHRSGSSC